MIEFHHVVSPFGARGGNGGVQDVDNLGWKLAAVLDGADYDLLESYNRERTEAADENIRHSARATRFMSPEEGAERLFRDQVLALAGEADFARGWVNSGRLSTPCAYRISAPDEATLPDVSRPGRVAPDAPLGNDWLLSRLGNGFTVLTIGAAFNQDVGVEIVDLPKTDVVSARYLGDEDQAVYLVRPDQHIAARWTRPEIGVVEKALHEVCGGVAQ